MTEEKKKKLLKNYSDRNVRWSTKAMNQLPFFSNLILGLSAGFFSFTFDKNLFKKMIIEINQSIDWSIVLLVISIILCIISIINGLLVAMNRLADFRVTRRINLSRIKLLKYGDKIYENENEILKKETWNKRQNILFKSMRDEFPKISKDDCEEYSKSEKVKMKVDEEFETLRNMTLNLGIGTWRNLNFQIILFVSMIITYIVGQLI